MKAPQIGSLVVWKTTYHSKYGVVVEKKTSSNGVDIVTVLSTAGQHYLIPLNGKSNLETVNLNNQQKGE